MRCEQVHVSIEKVGKLRPCALFTTEVLHTKAGRILRRKDNYAAHHTTHEFDDDVACSPHERTNHTMHKTLTKPYNKPPTLMIAHPSTIHVDPDEASMR